MKILRFALLLGAVMSLAVSLSEKPLSSAAINYARLPLSFEANQGQAADAVKFSARGSGYQLALTATEAVLQLRKAQSDSAFVKMKLVGANPAAPVNGRQPLPGKSNYFIGNDSRQWRTDVPHYARVEYEQVWPGVNLVYYGNQQQLEYDFIVAPGADPRAIKLAFEGAERVTVNAQGELLLRVAGGEVAMHKPLVYQEVNGVRQEVAGGYVVEGEQARFHLGEYDASLPLVIDPVLVYSTYLGGSENDQGLAIAVDSTGNVYVTGETVSPNFPTANPFSATLNPSGHTDAFVAKLNASGTALVYSTYLGGNVADTGRSIAVDAAGNAYVTGNTSSSTFPTTAGAFDRTCTFCADAFVTKLSAAGNTLVYSTFLGNSSNNGGSGIAIDGAGNAYVTGKTFSNNFPTTPGAFDTSLGGDRDYFVAKLNPAGSALVYSSYLGGSQTFGIEFGESDIAVDAAGNAYVTGDTESPDFPMTAGAFDRTCGTDGNCNSRVRDAFVTKFNAAGSALVYSTFLGGRDYDIGISIALDAAGNAYVTGQTASSDYPTTPGALQATAPPGSPFVTKLNAAGSALVYSTFLGSNAMGLDVAVDSAGNAHVAGAVNGGGSIPLVNPLPNAAGGSVEAFIAKLNASGAALIYSTLLGGRQQDQARGIALDTGGNAYVVGITESTDFLTKDPLRPNNAGREDTFIAKITDTPLQAQISLNPASLAFSAEVGRDNPPAKNVTLTNAGSGTMNWQAVAATAQGGNWLSVSPAAGALAANQSVTLVVTTNTNEMASGTYAGSLAVSSANASNSPQSIPVTLSLSCPPASFSGLSAAPGQQCSPTDALSIIAETPPRTEILEPGSTRNFSVTVSVALQTKTRASLDVQLLDGPDPSRANVLALGSVEVRRDEGTTAKVVNLPQAVTIPTDKSNLYLRAYLKDSELTIFKEAPLVTYSAGRNAVEIVSPKLDGQDAPNNSQLPVVSAGQKIAFECQLRHRLVSLRDGALRVRAFSAASGAQLAEAAAVPVTNQPNNDVFKFSFQIPPDEPDVLILAELQNAALTQLLAQAQIIYRNPSFRLVAGRGKSGSGAFSSFSAAPVLESGVTVKRALNLGIDFLALRSLDNLSMLPGTRPVITLAQKLKNGTVISSFQPYCYVGEPAPRPSCTLVDPAGPVRDDADVWEFRMEVTRPDNTKVRSKPLIIPIDRVRIAEHTVKRGDPLAWETPMTFKHTIAFNTNRPGSYRLEASVEFITRQGAQPFVHYPLDQFPSGTTGSKTYELPITIPRDTKLMNIQFWLRHEASCNVPLGVCAIRSERLTYKRLGPSEFQIPRGVDTLIKLNGLDIKPIQIITNVVGRAIRRSFSHKGLDKLDKALNAPRQLLQPLSDRALAASQPPSAAAPFRDLLSLNTVWQFEMATPASEGFTADLTFYYNADDFPDDPNFGETRLKVVGIDFAMGRLVSYPTTLDLANRTATARVNTFMPFYTLGVLGPFAQQTLNFPVLKNLEDFATRFQFTNLGQAAARLTPQAYEPTGEAYSPAPAAALAPAQQLVRSATELLNLDQSIGSGWTQIRSDKNQSIGYHALGQSARLDGLSAPAYPAGSLILTNLEDNANVTAEIHLANLTNFPNDVLLELYSANGNLIGSLEPSLAAKEGRFGRLQEFFPNLPQPFTGYLLALGDNDIAAAALLSSERELVALNGQPLVRARDAASQQFAPLLLTDGRAVTTQLTLVNPHSRAVNLTLRAVNNAGTDLAAPLPLTLAAGQLFQRDLQQAFNLNPTGLLSGSLIVESNVTGIAGHVSYFDPSGAQAFRAALPLEGEPSRAFGFAHVDNRAGNFTRLALYNPNAQAANVEVKVWRADGSQSGSTRLSLAANNGIGRTLTELIAASANQAGGYFTVTADQPIVATAVFGTANGTTLSAVPPQPIAAAVAAVANVSAASYSGQMLAAESIAAAFGVNLATTVAIATTLPLPTTLAGTTVSVRDSAGVERLAPLFFVAPNQINYLVPSGTAFGVATITVTSGDGSFSVGTVNIAKVAPGLFTANANSLGVAAAVVLRIKADGAQSYETLAQFDATRNQFVATPIDLGPASDQVFLLLFGTGARFNSGLANATCKLGGVDAPVLYVGAQGDLVGLDQVNVAVPRSLIGRGEIDLVLTVEGKTANTVRVNIK